MKKCFIYIRVSTDRQAKEGLSLEAQQDICNRYAQQQGWQIAHTFIEAGVSAGKEMSARPQYCNMIARIDEVDAILCWRQDRLLRNPADAMALAAVLENKGIEFHTAEESKIKLELPHDEFMYILKSALGRLELRQTSARIKGVMKEQTRRGCVVSGQIPYGFKIVGDKGNKHLEIDEEQAQVIRKVFDDYERTNALYKVGKLNNFSFARVKFILKCKQYIGIYDNPKRDLYIEDYCPAIVSKEQFFNVQRMLGMNVKRPRTNRVYIFGGLIECGECGRHYSAVSDCVHNSDKVYKRYRCQRGYEGIYCGNKKGIGEIKLEEIVLTKLKAEFASRQFEVEASKKQKADNTKQKAKLTAQKKKLIDLNLDGIIDKTEYERRFNELTEELNSIDIKEQTASISPDVIQAVLSPSFDDMYNSFTDDEKKRFWRSVVDKIVVYHNDNILIKFL